MRWIGARAPSLDVFETVAREAYERLPDSFRALSRDIVFRIDEFPTDEVLDALGIDNEFDLLGLYQGWPLGSRSVADPPSLPDMIFLYRRPILDYWAEHDDSLDHIIIHVLVHEIGHHFGLSDADMEAIELSVEA